MKYLVTITEKTQYSVTVEASDERSACAEAFANAYKWIYQDTGEAYEIAATPAKG